MSEPVQPSIFRRESLERLSSPEQLDQLMQVVTPRSWIPLATLGAFVGLALLWAMVGRISVTATGKGILVHPTPGSQELVGLLYFDPEEIDQIQLGMPVVIIPDAVRSERIGGIMARVKSISNPSITTLEAVRQAAVDNPTAFQPSSIEVLAELERDPSTRSGYRWTSAGGGQVEIIPGAPTTARIMMAAHTPITLIFPFLEASP